VYWIDVHGDRRREWAVLGYMCGVPLKPMRSRARATRTFEITLGGLVYLCHVLHVVCHSISWIIVLPHDAYATHDQ